MPPGPLPRITGSAGPGTATSGPPGAAASDGNLFPWLFPTSDFRDFEKYGSVALPAVAATATILSFQVPAGKNGRIAAIGMDFTQNGGAAFTQDVIPFQLTFNLLVNGQSGPPDFAPFNYLFSSVSAPTAIAGILIKEGQTITLQVTNNSIAVTTQFVAAHFQGYYYGKNLEPKILGNQ